MPLDLYRKEALDAQRQRQYGTGLRVRSPSLPFLTAAAVLVAVAVVTFLIVGQYTRKEHVSGYLAPTLGLIKVYTPQQGTVVEKRVSEGQSVNQGQVLLIVSSERATATNHEAQGAMLRELRDRRDSLRTELQKQAGIDALAADELRKRIAALGAELAQARAQFSLQQQRVASALRTVRRHEDLVAAKFVSEATVQEKQEVVLEQRSQLVALQRTITGLMRDQGAARVELESSALKKANNAGAIDRQISEIEQQLTEVDSRREVAITAPADGTVTTILAEAGQAAVPGTPLLSILPAGAELEATLLVPTRAAGFIRPAQTVALRYQAFPYQRFGHSLGEVREVGRTIIQPNETSIPVQVQEPVYRVTVRVPSQHITAYGQSLALRSGMLLDADVWIDRRSLIQWIFDPLLSVAGRV